MDRPVPGARLAEHHHEAGEDDDREHKFASGGDHDRRPRSTF
jgi:hypothetical protein